MTSETHTEGPWVYRPNEYDDWGTVRMASPDDTGFCRHICKVNYVASPEQLLEHRAKGTDPAECDARLIAAAPDLLEALKVTTERIVRLAASGDAGFWDGEEMDEVIAARAALAKAEGRS